MCRTGAIVGRRIPPEQRPGVRLYAARNVLRCHAGGARIFFISGTNYIVCCSEIGRSRDRHDGQSSLVSLRRPARHRQHIENNWKFGLCKAAGEHRRIFFRARSPGMWVAFGGSTGRLRSFNQFCASAAACRAVGLTEDPPFGGLWCDQPAIFLLAESRLRRFQRARLGQDGLAGKKRGFCRREARQLGTRASSARLR
jgi:hypothetical protein